MELEQALEMINRVMFAKFGRHLNDVETAIFTGSWHHQTYEQIAELSGYSISYIRKHVGALFWRLLSEALEENVSKTNFRVALERHWRQRVGGKTEVPTSAWSGASKAKVAEPIPEKPTFHAVPTHHSVLLHPLPTSIQTVQTAQMPKTDWGEALDISVFYGRAEELETLQQWIVTERCRFVSLLGMGGIGKSSLAAKVATLIQTQFEFVIWRSLRNAPPLEALLTELVSFVSNQQETQPKIERLLHWLRAHRCLIILDNGETILQAGDRAGHYQPDYENYADLFHCLGESFHQSCVLLTSREKPAEVGMMESVTALVRSLSLKGSLEAALAILNSKGLEGTELEKQQLCDHYRCSPLAIKIVATSIQSLFDGEIGTFLEQDTIVFNGLRRLLDQQFERLSHLERTILYWLAINREEVSVAELVKDIFPPVPRMSILEALESLSWRSLIEKQAGKYTQQPVVMEYVTENLTSLIATEIIIEKFSCFTRYALLKTTARDDIRESQRKLILEPIAHRLQEVFSTTHQLEQQFTAVLERLRTSLVYNSGYAAGNLINLANLLRVDLTEYDFSNLTVWHADLRKTNLYRVNFANADLSQSIFIQTFGYVLSVAIRPNGQMIATGDGNGRVRLWCADGQPLSLQQGHTSWVWSLAWNPTGTILAQGSVDQTIRLWHPETGECLNILRGHQNWVRSVAWSRDGVLASGSTDSTIKLWHPETGACLQTLTGEAAVWSISWSPNGKQIASGGIDAVVQIWHVETAEVLHTYSGHTQWLRAVSWSPDGRWLASGGDDKTIRLWDVETGDCLAILHGHTNAIWSLVWSPDSRYLASTSHDKTVRIWDRQDQHCTKVLSSHTNWVWGTDWSQEGNTLVTVAHDRMIKIWNAETWNCLRTIEGHTSVAMSIAWSPDGRIIASSCDDQVVRLWNVKTGTCYKTLQGHENVVWGISWSPDGRMLASSCDDQTVRLWDAQTGACLKLLEHSNWVWSVSWSPDGAFLASCTQDCKVIIWNWQTNQHQAFEGHQDSIWSVAWSADGHLVASGCDDQTVRIWDAKTGKCLQVLLHPAAVRSVAWHPATQRLVTGSADRLVRVWDAATGQCLQQLQGHTQAIWSVAWQPDGKTLASGGDDLTVRLWDETTGKPLHILKGHTSQIWSVAWSPSGQILASSSADQTIRLWEASSGNFLQLLRANRPYEGMNIAKTTGLTEAQRSTLRQLGAIN